MKKASNTSSQSFLDSSKKVFFLIFALCLFLYGNTLKNNYALDDELVVYKNELVQQGIKGIPGIFTSRYAVENEKSKYGYRPIVKTSFAIEEQFFNQNPAVSHFINIVLYAVICFLLFFVLRRLFPDINAGWIAGVILLFIFHPVHTEVVASLKNRDVLLSSLGGMLALHNAIKWADSKRLLYVAFTLFWMAFALLSKIDSLPFLAIIPVTLFFIKRVPFRQSLVFFAGLLVFILCIRVGFKSIFTEESSIRTLLYFENPLYTDDSLPNRLIAFFASFFFYLKILILPHPLISYYGFNMITLGSWMHYSVIAGILSVCAIGYYLFRNKFKVSFLWYGIIFFLIAVSMFLNLVKPAVGVVAERFVFIGSIGFCITVVACLALWTGQKLQDPVLDKKYIKTGFVVVLALMSIKVIGRNKDWKDHFTLYSNDVKNAQNSAKLHALMAAKCAQMVNDNSLDMEQRKKMLRDAVVHYKKSIEIYPKYITSHNNLGMLYHSYLKDYVNAKNHLQQAVTLDTGYAQAYFNLGLCEYELKNFDVSIAHLKKSIRIKPDFEQALLNLNTILIKTGRFKEANDFNNEFEKRYPQNATVHFNKGAVHMELKDTSRAVACFEQAVNLNPGNIQLINYLCSYYNSKGNQDKVNYFQRIALSGR